MAYVAEIADFIKTHNDRENFAHITKGLETCRDHLQKSCMWLMQNAMKDPEQAAAGSVAMMHIFGITALGFSWAKMALIAQQALENNPQDAEFYNNKLTLAAYYMDHYVPEIITLAHRVQVGKHSMMQLPITAF